MDAQSPLTGNTDAPAGKGGSASWISVSFPYGPCGCRVRRWTTSTISKASSTRPFSMRSSARNRSDPRSDPPAHRIRPEWPLPSHGRRRRAPLPSKAALARSRPCRAGRCPGPDSSPATVGHRLAHAAGEDTGNAGRSPLQRGQLVFGGKFYRCSPVAAAVAGRPAVPRASCAACGGRCATARRW